MTLNSGERQNRMKYTDRKYLTQVDSSNVARCGENEIARAIFLAIFQRQR